MKDDLREVVAKAMWQAFYPTGTTWDDWKQQVEKHPGYDGRAMFFAAADAAIAAARPVIGEECAKVAEDDRHLWGAAGGVGNAVLLTEPRVIAAAIRSATR